MHTRGSTIQARLSEIPPRARWSAAAIVVLNLWGLAGVFVFGWDAFLLAAVYWSENVIIGVFTYARLLLIRREPGPLAGSVEKALVLLFFPVHFGGFTAIQGIVLGALWIAAAGGNPNVRNPFLPLAALCSSGGWPFWSGAALLAISHGTSFVMNTCIGKEYRATDFRTAMAAPYPRVLAMQAAVILGAAGLAVFGAPRSLYAVLVPLKIFLDVSAHLKERARLSSVPATLSAP